MKVLCVCRGGNVRSVGLAFILKYRFGVDALAASAEANSTETLRALIAWADHVVLLSPSTWQAAYERIGPILSTKPHEAIHVEIGEDTWMNPLHPDLQGKLWKQIEAGALADLNP